MRRVPPLSLVLACSPHHLVLVGAIRMRNMKECYQAKQAVLAALLIPGTAQQNLAQAAMLLLQEQLSMQCQNNRWCTKLRSMGAAAAQPDSCS
jgi:hypothetical protein